MKLILMLFEKHAVELLLPALAAAVLILIVFFLFSNVREWKSLKQGRAAPRHGKSDESSNAGDEEWRSSSVSIPRFLLLGPSDSGKTALLDGLRHVSSRDRTWITDLASGVACWHLAGGEVLEIAGTLFPSGRNGNGAEKGWKDFLTHLHQQRPQRPLDGIILTLPSSHLCGDNALPAEDLQHQATQMAKQLKLLRDQLGFCFPLYLVITKCDAIPGYTTFVRAQLTPHLGEMFGWSTPYDQDAPFDPAWTAQAFADVNRALSSERVRFFTERGGNGPADDFAWMDDLFLFPARLSELQGGVSVYLEKLLENSGHRDALLFRGIYFTGSARHINEAFDESRSGNHAANRVGFTSDLFDNKIFAERSLAHPVETALTHLNASVSFYRALCIAAAVLLLPGAFFGWYSLSKASPEIIPHLERIHGSLSQGKSKPSSESAYSAIYAAQGLSGNNFQSIFLPASILDSLGPQVADIMTPVFNQIVYPGLRMDLEHRTSDLLRLTRHEESGNQTNAAPQPATGGNTAQSFSSFTDAFLSLEGNIVLYNGMSQTGRGNGKEMMALASSLSPGTFTSLRSRSTSGLNDIVRDSAGTPFDGRPWNKAAANKLEAMVTDVLRQSMNEEQLLGSLDTLVSKINLLEKNKLDTYAQLNGLLQSLGQVQTYLAAPDLQWIARNEDRVQLPDDLKRSLDRIFSRPTAKNVLLCDVRHEQDTCDNLQEVKATIEQIGREHFVNMRKLLLDASTTTTGPLVATTDTKLQLSQPAVNLQTVLNNFLKLPFVAHEGTARLRDIESGQQLFWDNDRLQAAVQDKQAYDQFFGSQLANTSENLQDTFEDVALSRLEANMNDSIASAQQFQPLPAGDKLEQATRDEARNFQAASQSLNQLLQQFSELNFDDAYQDLLRVNTDHVLTLLSRIDRAFDARHFYWPPAGKFDAWTSNALPSSAVYAVHSPEEMAGYLVTQRQDVEQYAAAAQPLVAFLQEHGISNQKQRPLLAKWQSIVGDLKKYESTGPASGLGSVEDLLANNMDRIAPPDCQTPSSPGGSNLVYFVQVRHSLERALTSRCRALSTQSAYQQYSELAEFFNQRLAGKFPFAPPTVDPAAPEADPSDVIELFRILDANAKSIRQGLQTSSASNPATAARMAAFITQIDAVRPLFASLFTGQTGAAPAFDLAPAFRVNRGHEINGNQIIDWNLQIGGNTFRHSDPPSTGRWNYGEPVKVMLRWAKDSPQQPVPLPPATANPNTRTVIFEYQDPWSMLRMLVQHAAATADLDRGVDSDPQTLVFTAGQENTPRNAKGQPAPSAARDASADQIAKVFIRLRIFPPNKTDVLRVAPFPVRAPTQ